MIRRRDKTDLIFVHCSGTSHRQDIGVRTIHKWHAQQGVYSELGLSGFHFVIRRNGRIEVGRPLSVIGAHTLGHNHNSVGICLVGGGATPRVDVNPSWDDVTLVDNFKPIQLSAFAALYKVLMLIYPEALLAPHSAVSTRGGPAFDLWCWQELLFGINDREAVTSFLWHQEESGED